MQGRLQAQQFGISPIGPDPVARLNPLCRQHTDGGPCPWWPTMTDFELQLRLDHVVDLLNIGRMNACPKGLRCPECGGGVVGIKFHPGKLAANVSCTARRFHYSWSGSIAELPTWWQSRLSDEPEWIGKSEPRGRSAASGHLRAEVLCRIFRCNNASKPRTRLLDGARECRGQSTLRGAGSSEWARRSFELRKACKRCPCCALD
jgi:hypothetical protein